MDSKLQRPTCDCLNPQYENEPWSELTLHKEVQDEECEAWILLQWLIEQARVDGRKKFSPRQEMSAEQWAQIVTLPPNLGTLKQVEHLDLYGSPLVCLPPEIGEMTSLKEFDPYTSYRLHWFPYEITRCENLKRSRISTRALYGNYKFRSPFPRLPPNPVPAEERGIVLSEEEKIRCSVCYRMFSPASLHQVWITLRVATDWMPLLVNACSKKCVEYLPAPAKGYVEHPHKGGLDLMQPPPGMEFMRQNVEIPKKHVDVAKVTKEKSSGFISRWFFGKR